VSITVAYQQTDIPKEIFDKMKAWLSDDCPDTVAGVVAVERGGVFGHEHLQGVAKVFATTPQQVSIAAFSHHCRACLAARHLNTAARILHVTLGLVANCARRVLPHSMYAPRQQLTACYAAINFNPHAAVAPPAVCR
jgi:hypothetical protein